MQKFWLSRLKNKWMDTATITQNKNLHERNMRIKRNFISTLFSFASLWLMIFFAKYFRHFTQFPLDYFWYLESYIFDTKFLFRILQMFNMRLIIKWNYHSSSQPPILPCSERIDESNTTFQDLFDISKLHYFYVIFSFL